MHHEHSASHNIIMTSLLLFALVFLIAGLFTGDISTLPGGLYTLFTAPAPRITDFTALAPLNAVLFNVGLMGLYTYLVYVFTGLTASGGCYGAYFMCLGLGFFGKTPITLTPFVLGGWLYAKVKHEHYKQSVLYPLQAAALSPVMTVLAFGGESITVQSVLTGFILSTLLGFIITPVALHTRSMHRGFDLYNVGLAAGLIGVCFFALYRGFYLVPNNLPDNYIMVRVLGPEYPQFFIPFIGGIFLAVFITGFFLSGRSFKPFMALRRHTGLDIDFVPEFGIGAVLVNMGLLGLMMLGYLLMIDAPMNGNTIGGLICVLCWAGNGANTRNVLPILVGCLFGAAMMDLPASTQYLCVAACYATGLAPLAGRFGNFYGIFAGMLHAFLSGITPAMHGSFNLYNGGFTAGLTALVLFPIIHSLSHHEYHDYAGEKHPGLVMELATDAVHIAEGAVHIAEEAAHLVAHDKTIVQTLPEDHHVSKTEHTFLTIRNIFAIAAGTLFVFALMPMDFCHHYGHVLRFAAYILGAGAYSSEIIVLTDGLRKKPGFREMCMPYMFGVLYVILGLNYLINPH